MQTAVQIILRLMNPKPLTDEEITKHIEWGELNDPDVLVNFHHPFYVGLHHDIPDDAPEEFDTLRDAMDLRKKFRLKHERIHEEDIVQNPRKTAFWFERPYRPMVAYILMRRGAFADDQQGLAKFIMDLWIDTEGPHENFVWRDILQGFPLLDGPVGDTELLDPSGTTRVYRGVAVPEGQDPDEEHGYSWTTDRKQAEWFARRFLGLGGRDVPVVLVGDVENDKVLFCTNDRKESEVVSGAVEVIEAHELENTHA